MKSTEQAAKFKAGQVVILKSMTQDLFRAHVYLQCCCPKCQTPEGANHWPALTRLFGALLPARLWAGKETKRNPMAAGLASVYRLTPPEDIPNAPLQFWDETEVWSR